MPRAWSEEQKLAMAEQMRARWREKKQREIRASLRWTWEHGSPAERAWMVRSHRNCATPEALCDLFQLTPRGLRAIFDGDDWRPQYSTESNLAPAAELDLAVAGGLKC